MELPPIHPGGETVLRMIRYDSDGHCVSPRTEALTIAEVTGNRFDRVIVFSHGWNNSYTDAKTRYQAWAREAANANRFSGDDSGQRVLILGVVWPSLSGASDEEHGPVIAADSDSATDRDEVATDPIAGDPPLMDGGPPSIVEVVSLAESLTPAETDRLVALTRLEHLNDAQADELARLYEWLQTDRHDRDPDDPQGLAADDASSDPDALRDDSQVPPPADDLFDETDGDSNAGFGGPSESTDREFPASDRADAIAELQAAGWGSSLWRGVTWPGRWLVRLASIRKMKDRAGKVGWYGVAVTIKRIRAAAPTVPIHLVGHSYGARVMLAASRRHMRDRRPSDDGTVPANVNSLLLLQPAVNTFCFAQEHPGGRPGGFVGIAKDVRPGQPGAIESLVLTHSEHDFSLTSLFHRAADRPKDLGEVAIASDGEVAISRSLPSEYAALGGYGPSGDLPVECVGFRLPLRADFELPPGMVSVNGDAAIFGHGDVTTPAVGRLLLKQLSPLGHES